MGRPTILKKAMTPAQRQRRRRKRLRSAEKQELNAERLRKYEASDAAEAERADLAAWKEAQLPASALPDRADELVQQICEAIHLDPDLRIDDIRDAIDRRFPPSETETGRQS
jgi:hypothetical protein